jgi:aspartyl-tRNA(Asn)/glutamyl-tRNA(Gln) amidotransferase subunit A
MTTDENRIAFASIADLGKLLRKRSISPVELAQLFLRRIEHLNPRLNAFLTVTPERALADARRAEKELLRPRSAKSEKRPLLGIPLALKDNIWTSGIRTTVGMKILRDFVPDEDATVVQRLTRAGAVLLGKNNLHECAYGVTNNNVHFGPARNPWEPNRITGGSSGGSAAAIAAGLCVAAVGTDTGGSLRNPASLCGVVGFKPTFGRVSVHGVFPLSPTMDHCRARSKGPDGSRN